MRPQATHKLPKTYQLGLKLIHNAYWSVINRLKEVGTFMNRREGVVEIDFIRLQHVCSAKLAPSIIVKWELVEFR